MADDTGPAKKPRKARKPSGPTYVFVVWEFDPGTNELTILTVTKKSDDVLGLLEGHSERSYKKVELQPGRVTTA